jgi:hypothetical protein
MSLCLSVLVRPHGKFCSSLTISVQFFYSSFIVKAVDKIQFRVKSDKNKTFYVNTHARLSPQAIIGFRSGNRDNCEVRRQAEKTLSTEHRS